MIPHDRGTVFHICKPGCTASFTNRVKTAQLRWGRSGEDFNEYRVWYHRAIADVTVQNVPAFLVVLRILNTKRIARCGAQRMRPVPRRVWRPCGKQLQVFTITDAQVVHVVT